MVSLVAENDPNVLARESSVRLTFGDWYKDAKDMDVEYLSMVRNYNGRRIETLPKPIPEKVQLQVLRAWDRVLERVPQK
jgi:hypothetical protein